MRTELRNIKSGRDALLSAYEAVGELDPRCFCREREDFETSPCNACLEIKALYATADALHAKGFNL